MLDVMLTFYKSKKSHFPELLEFECKVKYRLNRALKFSELII